jgi:hypothetical protein
MNTDTINMSAGLIFFREVIAINMVQYINPHAKLIEKKDAAAKITKIIE